ncbi:Uncharacterised protein [Shigella sonnei]|nr:Uncharacterised protein [Shigella sonnei]CSQ78787.1 Uncharacterised protein [Shigella sonnei]CSS43197.1 Uncharacterised protein [Shigella sonnei]
MPFSEIRQRDRFAFVIDNEHFFQRTDVLGIARIHFHHHFILVHRLVNGRDLPLTEGVI